MAETLGVRLREILVRQCAAAPGAVTVCLSAGIDSHAVLFAALDAGRTPEVVSFFRDGWVSTDFAVARETARRLKLSFRSVILPRDRDALLADVRTLVANGMRTKAEVECSWPFLHVFRSAAATYSGGYGADGHFGTSKKAMLHYRERMPEFRRSYFGRPHLRGELLHSMAGRFGSAFLSPFASPEVIDLFAGATWAEVNTPGQKQPIRDAFGRDFARWGVAMAKHENLQLGDSRIAETFLSLLTLPGFADNRSPVAVYNAVARGEL